MYIIVYMSVTTMLYYTQKMISGCYCHHTLKCYVSYNHALQE